MRKTLALILALACAAPLLTACGSEAMADEPDTLAPLSSLRDEFACPGMHAEWIDPQTVQCIKELP